jgi:AraC family transcriptional regulator
MTMNLQESLIRVDAIGPVGIDPAFLAAQVVDYEPSTAPWIRALLEQALMHWDYDAAQACLVRARALAGRDSNGLRWPAGLEPRRRYLEVYIDRHLDSHIHIRDLAALMHLSVSQFHRLFQRYFNATPMSYVTSRRIRRAQSLMQEPGKKLADIALACGFCDQAHFCRVFKQTVGTSPARWRRHCSPS